MSITQPINDALNPAPGYKPDNTFVAQDDSVATKLNGLLSQSSPLMTQASTQAAQAANKRGLQNSSIAVESGQDALIKNALPIASQDAAATTQKNLSAQGTAQSKELQAQGIVGQKELLAQNIVGQQALQNSSIDAQAKLQYNQIASTEKMTQAQIESTEHVAQMNIENQQTLLGRQLNAAETQQIRQIAATDTLQKASISSQEKIAGMQISSNKELAQIQTQSQQTIAGMNISAADRQNATNANIAIQNTYATMFDTIANNPNIPADVRQQYLDSIKAQAQNSSVLVQSLYKSNVTWPTTGGGAGPPQP